MEAARSREAVRLVRSDGVAAGTRTKRIRAFKLGVIVLAAAANSAFWVVAILLAGRVTGIEINAYALAVFGLVTMAVCVFALAIFASDRR